MRGIMDDIIGGGGRGIGDMKVTVCKIGKA